MGVTLSKLWASLFCAQRYRPQKIAESATLNRATKKIIIKKIVVHCSDTPNERDVDAAEIHHWHLEQGWSGIGYHFVIRRNGEIEAGRPLYWMGSHALGHNKNTIGICLIGRDSYTDDQYKSLKSCADVLAAEFPDAEVCGHTDLNPQKACPNFDVKSWYEQEKIKTNE